MPVALNERKNEITAVSSNSILMLPKETIGT